MPAWEYPIEALKNAVEAILNASGDATPHYFGANETARNATGPRFVWVPQEARDRNGPIMRKTEELRTLFSMPEIVDVYCFGESYAQCWALRNNLLSAAHALAAVDVNIVSDKWVRPGSAVNQDGQLRLISISMACPVVDALVDPVVLEEPTQSTVEIGRSEADIFKSPDTDTDGELGVEVDVEG